MARALNRLSARFVATAVEAGRYADGGNLYLSISPNGGRRWVFLFRWQGKPTELGLGSARDITLARARERAAEARACLSEGKSPLDARRQIPADTTFGKAADDLIAAMAPSWRNEKHGDQWRMTLTEYAKPIRSREVGSITTEDILGILRPIWNTKPETASRVRGRIEAVLDAAKARGLRTGENVARWKGHLDKLLPPRGKLTRGHHAAMAFDDVPAFVAKLRETATTSNLALEFTILTAGRSGEIMGAVWSEFDLVEKVWSVPAVRMKGKRVHTVPLTGRMIAILDAVRRDAAEQGAFVFQGAKAGKPLSVMALAMALRRAGAGEFTVHGFRSAFRDWCGDRTNFPRDLAEAALAHAIRDATEAAYRRGTALEKRRALMNAWSSFVEPGSADQRVVRLATRGGTK